jgi:hypothetical protein
MKLRPWTTFFVAGFALVVTYLMWPFSVGKWIFEARCNHFAGVQIVGVHDARSDGFFDDRLEQQKSWYGVSTNHFWLDVEALASGRILFFEMHRRTTGLNAGSYAVTYESPKYTRYFLTDKGSDACISTEDIQLPIRSTMAALVPTKCLVSESTDELRSRYEIRATGYHHMQSSASTEVFQRTENKLIASFRSFNLYSSLNFVSGRDGVCPAYADRSYSPHDTLVSMVFVDRNGETLTLRDLEAKRQ